MVGKWITVAALALVACGGEPTKDELCTEATDYVCSKRQDCRIEFWLDCYEALRPTCRTEDIWTERVDACRMTLERQSCEEASSSGVPEDCSIFFSGP